MRLEIHYPVCWCQAIVYLKAYSDFEDNEKQNVVLSMWEGPDI